jgi:hypothetical protein
MAVQHLDSVSITDMVATPRVPVDGRVQGGTMKIACGTVTPAADDTANSTYRFCRIPSNAVVHHVLISAADATTAGAINVGIWQTEENGDTVVDADLFCSALDLTGGPFLNSDQIFESGVYTNAFADGPLWEALALTADSQRDYDVVAQVSTTFNGGPTSIHIKVVYSV